MNRSCDMCQEQEKWIQDFLVGRPEWMRLLGRPRNRREVNIMMDLWEGVDWISLAQDTNRWKYVNMIMNFWVLCNLEKFLTSWEAVAFEEGICSKELLGSLISHCFYMKLQRNQAPVFHIHRYFCARNKQSYFYRNATVCVSIWNCCKKNKNQTHIFAITLFLSKALNSRHNKPNSVNNTFRINMFITLHFC